MFHENEIIWPLTETKLFHFQRIFKKRGRRGGGGGGGGGVSSEPFEPPLDPPLPGRDPIKTGSLIARPIIGCDAQSRLSSLPADHQRDKYQNLAK